MIKLELSERHAQLLNQSGTSRVAADTRGRFVIELELELIEALLRKAEAEDRELAEVLVDHLIAAGGR